MGNLDFPQAVEEIKQAAKWLREQGAPKVPLTVHLLHHERPPFSSFCPISNPSFPFYSHKLVHQMASKPAFQATITACQTSQE